MKKILGRDEDGYYLLDLGTGMLYGRTQHLGQIYYSDEKKLYPVNALATLQSRQEWEPYTDSQDVLQEWLKDATPVADSLAEKKEDRHDIETM